MGGVYRAMSIRSSKILDREAYIRAALGQEPGCNVICLVEKSLQATTSSAIGKRRFDNYGPENSMKGGFMDPKNGCMSQRKRSMWRGNAGIAFGAKQFTKTQALWILSAFVALTPGCGSADFDGTDDFEENVGFAQSAVVSTYNLAQGKPATQSSTAYGGVASRAVDGNGDGYWNNGSVTHTNNEAQAWWQVDLQSVQAIGDVVLYNRRDCCLERLSNFKVRVSNDQTNWTDYNIPEAVPAYKTIAIGQSARYVRVQLNGTNFLSLAEVMIFPPNLARGKVATQSSTATDYPYLVASRAVDGYTDGYYASNNTFTITHTNNEVQPWWQVDLEGSYNIGSIALYNRTDCCSDRLSNFRIEGSTDGFNFTQILNYPGTAGPLTILDVNATTRYVRVRLNGTNALSLAEVQVYPAPAAPPSGGSSLPTLVPTTPIGATPGSFGVSSYGQATYSIPIAVPPGRNGVEPKLAINYDSSAPNGTMGVGFALNGLSRISRCGKTVDNDGTSGSVNIDANDRFCLDGRRLVAIAGVYGSDGAEYRTEVDTWNRVFSRGTCGTGPCRFDVYDKQGNLSNFGGSADTQPVISNGTVVEWPLRKQSTTDGNYMTVSYANVQLGIYPIEILYTMHDGAISLKKRRVAFTYEDRANEDRERRYAGDQQVNAARRLTQIDTSVETSQGYVSVRQYRLGYRTSEATRRSLLESVTECDGAGVCLPATTFTWQQESATDSKLVAWPAALQGAEIRDNAALLAGDFNGDGKTDIISRGRPSTNTSAVFKVNLSNGDGTFTSYSRTEASYLKARFAATSNLIPGDFNGDGMTDFIVQPMGADANTRPFQIHLSNGDGTFQCGNTSGPTTVDCATETGPGFETTMKGESAIIIPGDYNGDGLIDFIRQPKSGAGASFAIYFSNGDGTFNIVGSTGVSNSYVITPGDFDGDGKTDFVRQRFGTPSYDCTVDVCQSTFVVFFSNGDGTFRTYTPTAPAGWVWQGAIGLNEGLRADANLLFPGDFNGDGKTDLLRQTNYDFSDYGRTALSVLYSRGNGMFDGAELGYYGFCFEAGANIVTGDWNGDGRLDFFRQGHPNGSFYSNTTMLNGFYRVQANGSYQILEPSASEYQVDLKGNFSSLGSNLITGDFDGDRKDDILLQRRTSTSAESARIYLSKGSAAPADPTPTDRITSIVNGLGGKTTIEYSPLHAGARIASGALAADLNSMYVVNHYENDDDVGHVDGFTFLYGTPMVDFGGRGLLGFNWVHQTSDATQDSETRLYHQEFPFTGLMKDRYQKSFDGDVMRAEHWTYTDNPIAQNGNVFHRVKLTSESVENTDNDVTLRTTKDFQYDAYDNVALIHDRGGDADSYDDVDTCTQFYNDATNWRLGYPSKIAVADSCTFANNVCTCTGFRRHTLRYYNTSSMTLTSEKLWQGSHWLETAYTYDNIGNESTRTEPTGKMTCSYYDADFRSLVNLKVEGANCNAPNPFITNITTDPRFGIAVSSIEPSGNFTAITIDGLGRTTNSLAKSPAGILTPVAPVTWGLDARGPYRETSERLDWNMANVTSQVKREYLDGWNRVYREEVAPGTSSVIVKLREFDDMGRISRESIPAKQGEATTYLTKSYDALGRLGSFTDAAGLQTTIAYAVDLTGAPRFKETIVEGANTANPRTSYRWRTARDLVSQQQDADGRVTKFGYDRFGQRTTATDTSNSGQVVLYNDGLGNVTRVDSPDRGTSTSTYSAAGLLAQTQDANGQIVDYTYDIMGRLTQKVIQGRRTINYEYDNAAVTYGKGRLTGVSIVQNGQSTPSSTYAFAYTPDGQVATRTMTMDGRTYTLSAQYDPMGRRTSQTFPDNSVLQESYNTLGFLSTLAMGGTNYLQQTAFTGAGQPLTADYGNGMTTQYGYDTARRLTSLKAAKGNAPALLHLNYTWNNAGRISQIQDVTTSANSQSFTYSPAGALTQAIGVYGTLNYAYDAVGNLTSNAGSTFGYTNHRVVSGPGMTATYDLAGNRASMVKNGVTTAYTYDGEQRLSQVTTNGNVVSSFDYDFDGQRIMKVDADGTKTHYVTKDFEVLFMTDGRRIETKYVNGPAGRVAAVSVEIGAAGAMLIDRERQIEAGAIFDKSSFAGMMGYLSLRTSLLASHPRAPIGFAAVFALLLSLAVSRLIRGRRFVGNALAWLRRTSALEGTEFARRNPIYAFAVPVVLASFLAACNRAPVDGWEATGQVEEALVAGANGDGRPVAGTYYFHHNHIGSSSVITSEQGGFVARTEYKPYGEWVDAASPGQDTFRAKFTGKEWDKDAGLYYFDARYYDPMVGRFLTADSLLFGGPVRNSVSLNPYAYGLNNPVSYTDPSGHLAFFAAVFLAAFLGGAKANRTMNIFRWKMNSRATWAGIVIGGALGATSAIAGSNFPAMVMNNVLTSTVMTAQSGVGAKDFFKRLSLNFSIGLLPMVAKGEVEQAALGHVADKLHDRVNAQASKQPAVTPQFATQPSFGHKSSTPIFVGSNSPGSDRLPGFKSARDEALDEAQKSLRNPIDQ